MLNMLEFKFEAFAPNSLISSRKITVSKLSPQVLYASLASCTVTRIEMKDPWNFIYPLSFRAVLTQKHYISIQLTCLNIKGGSLISL